MSGSESAQVDQLQIDVRHQADRLVVRLRGELDLASAPLLQSELQRSESQQSALVLDVDGLAFIDSTGLRIILAAHERSQEQGRQFAVTRGSQQVQRLLSITRAGEHLHILDEADGPLS